MTREAKARGRNEKQCNGNVRHDFVMAKHRDVKQRRRVAQYSIAMKAAEWLRTVEQWLRLARYCEGIT